jgi:hypothetical protein
MAFQCGIVLRTEQPVKGLVRILFGIPGATDLRLIFTVGAPWAHDCRYDPSALRSWPKLEARSVPAWRWLRILCTRLAQVSLLATKNEAWITAFWAERERGVVYLDTPLTPQLRKPSRSLEPGRVVGESPNTHPAGMVPSSRNPCAFALVQLRSG